MRKVYQHQSGDCDISEIIRYTLNEITITFNKDNKDKIKEVDLYYEPLGKKILKNNITIIRKKYLIILQNILFLYTKIMFQISKNILMI